MNTKEGVCNASQLSVKKIILSIFFLLVLCRTAGAQDSQKATLTAADAGTCSATSTACLVINVPSGSGGATFNIGANASANTVQFEATADYGTTWVALNVVPSNGTTAVTSTTSTGIWQANVAGYTKLRMRCSTFVGGTTTTYINLSTASARSGGGGAGSVTHTAGNLTAGNVVIGNGAADVKVDSACVTNGTGALSGCTSITATGTISAPVIQSNSAATNCQNLFASGQYPSGFFSGHCSPPVLAQSNQWIDPLADGLPGDATTTDGSYNLGWGVKRRTLTGTAYTNATTTFSNVVGSAGQTLQFTVAASANYKISCDIEWQGSANTTGPKWQWTGPASPTALVQYAHNPVTTSTYLDAVGSKTAFSSPMADTGTITAATDFVSHLDLELVNGVNAGTVVLQAAANGVGTLTIQPGSSCVSNGDK